jgi:hypothetical protein
MERLDNNFIYPSQTIERMNLRTRDVKNVHKYMLEPDSDEEYVDWMPNDEEKLSKKRKGARGEDGLYKSKSKRKKVSKKSSSKKQSSSKKKKTSKKNGDKKPLQSSDDEGTLVIDDPNSYYNSDEYDVEGKLIKRDEEKKRIQEEERLQRKMKRKPNTPHLVKKYTPVPMDENGKPILPIVLRGLTIETLGTIVYDRPKFHAKR